MHFQKNLKKNINYDKFLKIIYYINTYIIKRIKNILKSFMYDVLKHLLIILYFSKKSNFQYFIFNIKPL